MQTTENIRINSLRALISPDLLLEEIPLSSSAAQTVYTARRSAADIIHGHSDRLLVIIGPCSIHDPKAALEYATLLKQQAAQYTNDLHIIMRVYFEKPRTTIGWKGLINDPNLNDSFNINQGLRIARKLLRDINELGLPTGSEFLDPFIPQYISDLTTWSAIGARTTESQIHRELASGLSMPVGFKNGTRGNITIAIDAIAAAENPHHFLGVTKQGTAAIVSTNGNPDCHVILRGANNEPNYDEKIIQDTAAQLQSRKLNAKLIVDCSHGNSNKDHNKQANVVRDLCQQMHHGNSAIMGVMIESNLIAGKQKYQAGGPLTYGQSITDACIDWEKSATLLQELSQAVQARRQTLAGGLTHGN